MGEKKCKIQKRRGGCECRVERGRSEGGPGRRSMVEKKGEVLMMMMLLMLLLL